MKEINPLDLNENVFKVIGKDWFLITDDKDGKCNTMTASWGGMGVLFNKNVVTIYVRPSRYTKSFLDADDRFSLCVMPEKYRDQLKYCGKVSGRDEDKIKKCGFTLNEELNTVYFNESRLVFICKKLYEQQLDSKLLKDNNLRETFWNDDVHVMYIAEIEKILLED